MNDQEYELRKEEIKIKLEDLELRKNDSRRAKWTNPMFVAIAASMIGFFGQHLVREQGKIQAAHQIERDKKQFCYRAIADFLERANGFNGADTVRAARELKVVVNELDLETECNGDLRELTDLFSSATPPGSAAKSGQTQIATGTCKKIMSIKKLGWAHGHKTKFCKAKGYDGVHNPFDDYSDGGFCFSGDINSCKAQMTSASR